MMKTGIFITGTGTDVGKTYVAALLVKTLRQQGVDAGYYKPVLSGAVRTEAGFCLGDADYVVTLAGLHRPPEELVSYCFEPAVSPHLAAELCGVTIAKEKILSDFAQLRKDYEFMVIEGAGGISCPLSLGKSPFLISDLIKAFGFPALIVADAGLGTLNHTLLTAEYARTQGIALGGVVLNRYDAVLAIQRDNCKVVAAFSGVPLLGTVAENAAAFSSQEGLLKACLD